MRRCLLVCLISVVLFACDSNNKARDEFKRAHPDFSQKFESRINTIYQDNKLHGDFLIGIVNQQGQVYSYAINRDILAGEPSSLNSDSPIYIASHTKSFTGTLLKILEEEGRIDLNKTMHDYLPQLVFDESVDTKSITVKDMLNHTHGINSTMLTWKTAFLGYDGGNEELVHALNSNFRSDPSRQFRYANTGPVLAAMVVDEVSGNSWKKLMKEKIFTPLGMTNTSCDVSDYSPQEIIPAILVTKDGTLFSKGFYKKDNSMSAAGGTISTINDLSKWLKFNINQETSIIKNKASFKDLHGISSTQKRTYFSYDRFGYSLGWDLATYQKDTILTRFGTYAGMSFHLSFIPARKIGVVAFINENRAARLPHLMANYAYNLIGQNPEIENVFNQELEMFKKSFNKPQRFPAPGMKLSDSDESDRLLGTYTNNLGWPEIRINKNSAGYEFIWGSLNGPVYKIPDPDQSYLSSLGPLMRQFGVSEKKGVVDSLFTGSLKYKKVK